MNLVNWDTVCLPKHMGGLGIYKTKDSNEVALAKLNWRLWHKRDSL